MDKDKEIEVKTAVQDDIQTETQLGADAEPASAAAEKKQKKKKFKNKDTNKSGRRRITFLDEFRGFCVFCMLFYHSFVFMDMDSLSFGTAMYNFFLPIQPAFSAAFILICGYSCTLSHSNSKRGFELFGLSILLNIVTIYVIPLLGISECEIYFGILNLLSCAILLYALFEKLLKKINPMAGFIICLILWFLFRNWVAGRFGFGDTLEIRWPYSWHSNEYLFPFGIMSYDFFSADYFPLIPNLFPFFAGAFLGLYYKNRDLPEFVYKPRVGLFRWLGQHALIIYIVHMPIIFVLLEAYLLIFKHTF